MTVQFVFLENNVEEDVRDLGRKRRINRANTRFLDVVFFALPGMKLRENCPDVFHENTSLPS
jgi:hypothetical protein